MKDPTVASLARALGRIPTGLYIVSTRSDDHHLGFVASLLTQVGLNPPTICCAIAKERDHYQAAMDTGSFGVSILDGQSSDVMTSFFKPPAAGTSPFDLLDTLTTPSGNLVIATSLAWVEGKVTGSHELGDHHVVFAEVVAGEQLHEGEPSVHLRKDGMRY